MCMSLVPYDILKTIKASERTYNFCETYACLGWRSCDTRIGKDFRKLQVLRPHLRHRPVCIPYYKLENRCSSPIPCRPAETPEKLKVLPKYSQGRNEVL